MTTRRTSGLRSRLAGDNPVSMQQRCLECISCASRRYTRRPRTICRARAGAFRRACVQGQDCRIVGKRMEWCVEEQARSGSRGVRQELTILSALHLHRHNVKIRSSARPGNKESKLILRTWRARSAGAYNRLRRNKIFGKSQKSLLTFFRYGMLL